MSSFLKSLEDPVIIAIPFFTLFMAIEYASLRFLDDDERARFKGYEKKDSRASILMGFGSLFTSGGGRILALFGYAALYELSPLRLPTHQWWAWVYALLAVDLLFYLEHR